MKKIERCVIGSCRAEFESRFKDIPHFEKTRDDDEKYPYYCPDCVKKAEAYDKAEREYIDACMEARRKAPAWPPMQFKSFERRNCDICSCGAIQKYGGIWEPCRCGDDWSLGSDGELHHKEAR